MLEVAFAPEQSIVCCVVPTSTSLPSGDIDDVALQHRVAGGDDSMSTLPWAEGPAEIDTSSLASWQGEEQTDGILTLSGACPRCGARITSEVSGSAVIVTAAAEGEPAFDAATFFQCGCSEPHAGRPPNKSRGCGAYWVARPKKNDSGHRYRLEAVTQPDLVKAATLIAEEGASGERAGLRALAEKWIPGIAAIIGILGLASVVVAKDSVEGLSQGWRGAAFGLVAVAVLAAAGATAFVYRAAFGWPKDMPLETDAQVLAAAREIRARNSKIAGKIRAAVGLSFASLIALLMALAIFWLQPDSERPIEVTYTNNGDDVTVCGKLSSVDDGALLLKITDGAKTTTERIGLATVTDLKQTAKCGG